MGPEAVLAWWRSAVIFLKDFECLWLDQVPGSKGIKPCDQRVLALAPLRPSV